uniref:Katanin p60 ATPase-containing subunit A-like 1 n=1 Tax=Sphaerodactylus townsendi TaxID=933632 RepID=A0ACB8FHG4_9SAUR
MHSELVRQELLEEYEQVKIIVNTLESFKIDRPTDIPVSYQDEPFRDPSVWPPPVPAEHRAPPQIKSILTERVETLLRRESPEGFAAEGPCGGKSSTSISKKTKKPAQQP